jgi:hypothetical protein
MKGILARKLLVRPQMGVLAPTRDRTRTARSMGRDHRVEIVEAQLATTLPRLTHLWRMMDIAASPPLNLAKAPAVLRVDEPFSL